MTMRLSIAREFRRAPMGRNRVDGKYSGEAFREDLLRPRLARAIDKRDVLVVNFDGMSTLTPSFMEEAFGGLVRENSFSVEDVLQVIRFEPEGDPFWDSYFERIKQFMRDAEKLVKAS